MPTPPIAKLLDRLEELGFYRYARPEDVARLKAEASETGYLFGGERTCRDYLADSEDLGECGVKRWVDGLMPFLEKLGVNGVTLEEDFGEDGYIIFVNGVRLVMYTEEEMRQGDVWELITRRAFALVNDLLETAGSPERLYMLYGGTNQRAILMTEEIHQAIRSSGLLELKEIPIPVRV